jgi:hypothetical protein
MKLKPLSVDDKLFVKYALVLDNGKVQQYQVRLMDLMASGLNAEELILKKIEEHFPGKKIEIMPQESGQVNETVKQLASDSFFALLNKKTLKNLLKKSVSSTLLQEDEKVWYSGLMPIFKNVIKNNFIRKMRIRMWDSCIEKINKIGHDEFNVQYKTPMHAIAFKCFESFLNLVDVLSRNVFSRKVYLARTLLLVCEEKDLDKAITQMAEDLELLDKKATIIGHLSNSAFIIVRIANDIGTDDKIYGIASISFVKKQSSLTEPKFADLIKKQGVRSIAMEGSVNYYNNKQPCSDMLLGEPITIQLNNPIIYKDSNVLEFNRKK